MDLGLRWHHCALVCLALAGCGDDSASEDTDAADAAGGSEGTEDTSPSTTGADGSSGTPAGSSSTNAASETADLDTSGESGASSSGGDVPGPDVPVVDCGDFPSSIDAQSLMGHLDQLQAIGDEHGNRSVGTAGYEESADYVRMRLEAAGYGTAADQEFQVVVFEQLSPTAFSSGDPLDLTYAEEQDFFTARYSGSGTVTAPIYPIDINIGGGNANSSGCQPADFDGFPKGAIALIQRGGCNFVNKVNRATAEGAAGVVIFNQGSNDNQ